MRHHGKEDKGGETNSGNERSHIVFRGSIRDRVPTTNQQRKLASASGIHGYDRTSQRDAYPIPVPWLAYKFAIISASSIGFGIGLGQLLYKCIGG